MKATRISFDRVDNYISQSAVNTENEKASGINPVLLKLFEDNLTKTQKCYIILYYKNGWTMEKIGAQFGVTKSTVSRTILRARRRLVGGLDKAALRRLLSERE